MKDLDPSHAATLDDLAGCLTQLHIRADMPSLRVLEQQSGAAAGRPLAGSNRLKSVRLGRTSLSEVLNGRKFPKKAFMLTFVEACGIDLMADRRWEKAWNRLAPQHADDVADQEVDLQQQIAKLRAEAEQASAENNQLRQQVTELLKQAERASADGNQVLQQTAFGEDPGQPRDTARQPTMAQETQQKGLRRQDPEMIGPYAILGRLGAGAMGQVYLGRSAAGRLVAIKTIKVEQAEEAAFRTRFAQEVAAARKVSGFFTAAVVKADLEADMPWLATAYVPAPSLGRLVRACGPLPVTAVRWLAAGCAEALESIHAAGMVHRDLKPSNVLVAPDGPRVIDFGVAQTTDGIGLTTSRGAVGTPAYMAPEQANNPRETTTASDVYSLGATLLFAATGHRPYDGRTVMDVLARLATEEPDLSGLPDKLTTLITACMQRVPRERPTTSAILAQLGNFIEVHPVLGEAHSYLPGAATALITKYQRFPQFKADSVASDDITSASLNELPVS